MKVLFADPYIYHKFFWEDHEEKINEKFSQTIGWCLDDINDQCLKETEESAESLDEMIEESENVSEDDQIDNENASTLDEFDLDEEVEEEEQNNDLEPIIVDEESETNKGVEINIGRNMNSSSDLIWYPSLTETTNQLNMGVIGDLGSGKTQLLKSIIYQTIKQTEKNRNHKIKFLILDYKEDYTGERDNFINHIGGRIIEPRHIPLNIFNTKNKRDGENIDELQKTKGRVLYTFFNQLYRNIGPVQKDKLLDAVELAYSRNENDPTIRDVYQEYKSSVRTGDSVTSILRDIVDLNIFSNNSPK